MAQISPSYGEQENRLPSRQLIINEEYNKMHEYRTERDDDVDRNKL